MACTGFGGLASVRIAEADLARLQRNIVLSHAAGSAGRRPVDRPADDGPKAGSLAQGACGVRRETLALLQTMLARGMTPVVPVQGSVGASGDLAPLAHMAAAMIGVGEAFRGSPPACGSRSRRRRPRAARARSEGGPRAAQRHSISAAYALAALFEAERLFQSALLSAPYRPMRRAGPMRRSIPRIHALRGQRGQIETAATLRDLMAGSAIRASHLTNDDRVQDPYRLRCQPQVIGAALDILRQPRRRWHARPTA